MTRPSATTWIDRVATVLGRSRVDETAKRALVDALSAAPDPLRAQLFVEGRTPTDAGIIAPADSRLVRTATGFELYFDGVDAPFYEHRVDPALLLVPSDARVRAGQRLKHGDVPAESWITTLGDDGAPRVIDEACEQIGLSRPLAELLVRPMLDGVAIVGQASDRSLDAIVPESSAPIDWPTDTLMTRHRFGLELCAACEHWLRAEGLAASEAARAWLARPLDERADQPLPEALLEGDASARMIERLPLGRRALLHYRALERMDDEGLVLDSVPIDCGGFDLTSGTLSVSDVTRVERRPDRSNSDAPQQSFGARRGRWRATVRKHFGGRLRAVRLWHEDARVWIREAPRARVRYGSSRILVCDLDKRNVDRARAASFVAELDALLAGASEPGVAIVPAMGLVFEGRPREARALIRVQRGDDERVVAMEITL